MNTSQVGLELNLRQWIGDLAHSGLRSRGRDRDPQVYRTARRSPSRLARACRWVPPLGHDRILREQVKVAQREEAGESEYKTSFLSNVNNTNTTAKIPVVVHIQAQPRETVSVGVETLQSTLWIELDWTTVASALSRLGRAFSFFLLATLVISVFPGLLVFSVTCVWLMRLLHWLMKNQSPLVYHFVKIQCVFPCSIPVPTPSFLYPRSTSSLSSFLFLWQTSISHSILSLSIFNFFVFFFFFMFFSFSLFLHFFIF